MHIQITSSISCLFSPCSQAILLGKCSFLCLLLHILFKFAPCLPNEIVLHVHNFLLSTSLVWIQLYKGVHRQRNLSPHCRAETSVHFSCFRTAIAISNISYPLNHWGTLCLYSTFWKLFYSYHNVSTFLLY